VKSEPSILRGFTVDKRVWLLSGVSIGIGICATFLAVLLLRCIALSTNLFYYHRFSIAAVAPAGSPLGHWMVVVPVVGGLLVGLMARFGSDKIRGHGIPASIHWNSSSSAMSCRFQRLVAPGNRSHPSMSTMTKPRAEPPRLWRQKDWRPCRSRIEEPIRYAGSCPSRTCFTGESGRCSVKTSASGYLLTQ